MSKSQILLTTIILSLCFSLGISVILFFYATAQSTQAEQIDLHDSIDSPSVNQEITPIITIPVNTPSKKDIKKVELKKKDILSELSVTPNNSTNSSIVVPKKYNSQNMNISKDINLDPKLIVFKDSNQKPDISITCGFLGDNKVNFRKIVFYIDEETIEWNIKEDQLNTKTIDENTISEWTIQTPQVNQNLIDHMKKICDSSNTIIRFYGKGFEEFTITKEQKNSLKLILKLYELY